MLYWHPPLTFSNSCCYLTLITFCTGIVFIKYYFTLKIIVWKCRDASKSVTDNYCCRHRLACPSGLSNIHLILRLKSSQKDTWWAFEKSSSNPWTEDKTVTKGMEQTPAFSSLLMIMTIINLTIEMVVMMIMIFWDEYDLRQQRRSVRWLLPRCWPKGWEVHPVWLRKGSATIFKPTSDRSSCNPRTMILKDQLIHRRPSPSATLYSYRYSGYKYSGYN